MEGARLRILVIHAGALGDCVLAVPALTALRRHFPEAYVELAGYPSPHGLLQRRGPVDRVVSMETLGLYRAFAGELPEDLAAYLRSFDLIISWFGHGDEGYRRALESLRVGENAPRVLIARSTPPEGSNEHAADYLLGTLSPLGVRAQDVGDRTPRLQLLDEDHEAAERILRDLGVRGETGSPLVAVHPGSGSLRKCWPAERFAQLIRRFERRGLTVLLLEGPADASVIERVLAAGVAAGVACEDSGPDESSSKGDPAFTRAHLPVRLSNLPLPHLAAVLTRCHLFVGNDSGVTHLAASVGTPVIALFTVTDPQQWGPRGRVTILRGMPDVADVLRESLRLLKAGPSAPPDRRILD